MMNSQSFVVEGYLEVVSFLKKDGKGLLGQEVSVEFNKQKYAMKETEETRQIIDDIWLEKTTGNKRLYNASKYRLSGCKYDETDETASLKIGLTDYKDHLGTNLSPRVKDFVLEGEEKYAMMAQCIGVGAWSITTDGKILLIERAGWTGEGAGLVDRPGGHAEPDEAKGEGEEQVREELFLCIQRELRDEVNIGLELQKAPELIGVILNLEKGGRCTLDYLIELEIDSKKVSELYKEGGAESDESTDLLFMDVADVLAGNVDKAITSRFTPHATGSIELLRKRLQNL